jgi:hypothetical protein
MSIGKSSDENNASQTEAYYEQLARQEEIYLEEREEAARAILISEISPSRDNSVAIDRGTLEVKGAVTDAESNPAATNRGDEELDHATEELITGDSDDPPLSEEAVVEMLRTTQNR